MPRIFAQLLFATGKLRSHDSTSVVLISERRLLPQMWDDPSLQVRFVCLFGGIAPPAIVLGQFPLNKVIAHFRNGHRQMASLESIRVEFAQ
jgi:hypothetical protein